MNGVQWEIITQIINNLVLIGMSILIMGLIFRGFFFKFIVVKLSLGKYLMVKVRSVNRDYFRKGWIEEGQLLYKMGKNTKTLVIPKDRQVIYRALGVSWIDVDEDSNGLCSVNYEPITGFDAIKQDDLLKRALYKPIINEGEQIEKLLKITMIIAGAAILAGAIAAFFAYQNQQSMVVLQGAINALKPIVPPSGL